MFLVTYRLEPFDLVFFSRRNSSEEGLRNECSRLGASVGAVELGLVGNCNRGR